MCIRDRGIIKQLRDKGVACIFITHKLNEVFECADRVVVIRDGQVMDEGDISEFTEDKIITRMVLSLIHI